MKLVELNWDYISIGDAGVQHILVFVTNEIFRTSLLNSLGYDIKIEFKEEYNGNIILYIYLLDTDEFVAYNTNLTIKDYPPFEYLKNREVSFWSVGHMKDEKILFHLPERRLTF